jgi:hypothetical protein
MTDEEIKEVLRELGISICETHPPCIADTKKSIEIIRSVAARSRTEALEEAGGMTQEQLETASAVLMHAMAGEQELANDGPTLWDAAAKCIERLHAQYRAELERAAYYNRASGRAHTALRNLREQIDHFMLAGNVSAPQDKEGERN